MSLTASLVSATALLPAAADAAASLCLAPPGVRRCAPVLNPYAGLFAPAVAIAGSTGLMASSVPQSPAPVVQAFKHSGAYKARLKIHKIANFATLPLCHEGQVIARSMACPHQHAAVRWLERHSGFSAPSTIPSTSRAVPIPRGAPLATSIAFPSAVMETRSS